jgi:hypothetical protein
MLSLLANQLDGDLRILRQVVPAAALQVGNERVKLTHAERVKLTHLGLQNGRSGQER